MNPEKRVADLFNISNRFLRSIHLERDFQDPSALSSYIPTEFAKQCFDRIKIGLAPQSGQRAWRITGDYGSGKSSLALVLAHWFNGQNAGHRGTIDFRQFGVPPQHFAPLLVTCSRQPLGRSIIKALHRMTTALYRRGPTLRLANDLQRVSDEENDPTDDQVLESILQVNARLIRDGKAKGFLLILDELGKFLEFAALQPHQVDVFLLQRLAEEAARSGDQPFFMVSLLHQGFTAYADHLTRAEQREWEKVAGRFEEILFDQPIEQITLLITSALKVNTELIPKQHARQLKTAMEQALTLGWFGAAESRNLLSAATQLYPLHPTTLPVLIRFFRRFGQNERSLFGFLVSNEPFGLQSFSARPLTHPEYYRLHHFYDYVRTNFGHRLALQSYRSHWNLIDSLIESFATADELQVNVLKTVGVLNLLNDGDLLPTADSVALALAENGEQRQVRSAIEKLRAHKRVLYDRGHARGLCLWPHTSVDIEKAYDDARRAVDLPPLVAAHLGDFLETRPIVARRHYIETGNLRYYNIRFCSVIDLGVELEKKSIESDGLILVPLCETASERATAIELARTPRKERSNVLVAVPQPLCDLATQVQEVQRWEWVVTNSPELNADKYAREEVSRQQGIARLQLEKRVQEYVGFERQAGSSMLEWFYQGSSLKIRNGRHLLSELSRFLDETYTLAPCIHNELVNRRSLSSAAAAARMRLIERMFTEPNNHLLGMDPAKKPPEMSMYRSVLQKTGLHHQSGDTWRIGGPRQKTDETCRILPSLRRMRELVQRDPDARLNILTLFDELRKPPYGVRDGVIPLLLTVFAIVHEKDVAFYKDGTFLRELTAEAMLVLTKAPERFEIQFCRIAGVRAEFFKKLLKVLEVPSSNEHHVELLGAVKKLCVFVARLPQYVLNTKRLSSTALAVRDTILNARDPARLLFMDLPRACGFEPLAERATKTTSVEPFVKELKSALDDLRASYPELQGRLQSQLRAAFDLPGSFHQFRIGLAARAEQILVGISESQLRAFCLRLMDHTLPEHDWLESVGSYLALKPPSKWHDNEEEVFTAELAQVATRFHRIESILFANSTPQKDTIGVRLSITQANGEECEQVVHVAADEEEQLRLIQQRFEVLLGQHRRLGIAAASRALWKILEREQTHE